MSTARHWCMVDQQQWKLDMAHVSLMRNGTIQLNDLQDMMYT